MRAQKVKPIITPEKILEYRNQIKSVPESFIITSKNAVFSLLRFYNIKKAGRITWGGIFTLNNQSIKIGIACPESYGAPAFAIIVEELIALGVKRFIFVGAAGALQPSLKIGSAVLPTKAVIEEGTSPHYAKQTKYSLASEALNNVVEHSLRENCIEYHKGVTLTTDALYRETKEKVTNYRKKGVLCLDMETSALFTVTEYYKKEATALLYITDSLATLEWQPYFDSEVVEKGRVSLLKVAIDALCIIKNSSFKVKPLSPSLRGVIISDTIKFAVKLKRLLS